ncbi:holo-ACP synthase [Lusitaniella coriacea]|uniref:holo-ACP synthase n=1 Tax=Lusitaniella coriacea TaxID=1983105 RepID=UPI003CF13646
MIADKPLKFYNPMGDCTLTLVEVDSLRAIDEEQYFTLAERNARERGERRLQYLGGRLAVKQSILSYLPELSQQDVAIRRLPHGAPAVAFSDRGKIAAADAGLAEWLLSISHTSRYAAAWAIGKHYF